RDESSVAPAGEAHHPAGHSGVECSGTRALAQSGNSSCPARAATDPNADQRGAVMSAEQEEVYEMRRRIERAEATVERQSRRIESLEALVATRELRIEELQRGQK